MIFNSVQQNYLKNKKKLYHTLDGKQTKTSLLFFSSQEEEVDLIKYFWYNINVMMENNILNTGYCGKNFFLNYKSDNNKKIDFLNYPIDKIKLKNIIVSMGSYLPILMFFDEDECLTAIECVHTQHSLRIIKEAFQEKKLNDELFLFIIKPNDTIETKEIEFILPIDLYNKIGYLLNLKTDYFNEKFIKVLSNNSIDLWLLFKLYHKEASYYIVKNMEYLYENNIKPPSFLIKEVKNNDNYS